MLVGDVASRICILVDDLADTANTIGAEVTFRG